MRLPFGLFLSVALLAAGDAAARDIFVHNIAGDDASNGALETAGEAGNGPVRSIAKALHLARKGDRIFVAPTGTPYRECLTLQGGEHGGWEGAPFVLVGNGAVLDGSRKLSFSDWHPVAKDIFAFYPKKINFTQLYLDGRPAPQVEVPVGAETLPALEPKQWCRFRGVIHFRVEAEKMIDDYALSVSQHDVGITLYEVSHVVVSGFVVQGYRLDGINAADGVRHTLLDGNVVRGNGRSGLTVAGASRVTVAGLTAGENGAYQLRVEGYSKTLLEESRLLGDEAKRVQQESRHAVLTIDGKPYAPDAAAEAAPPTDPATPKEEAEAN